MSRWIAFIACLVALSMSGFRVSAQAGPSAGKSASTKIELPPPPKPLLPEAFAGWVAAEPAKTITDPTQADGSNAAALKEYDFTHAVLATYKRDNETLTIRALSFMDTSGSYGAYTYYRQNGWPKEEIGSGATSNHNRVLFWLGTTVVDANFLAYQPDVGRGAARACQPAAPRRRNKAIAPPDPCSTCRRPRSTSRPRTTRWARQAMRAREAHCRRAGRLRSRR